MTTSNEEKVNQILSNLGYKFPIKAIKVNSFIDMINEYNKSNNENIRYMQIEVKTSDNFDKGRIYATGINVHLNSVYFEIRLFGDEYGYAEGFGIIDDCDWNKNSNQKDLDYYKEIRPIFEKKIAECINILKEPEEEERTDALGSSVKYKWYTIHSRDLDDKENYDYSNEDLNDLAGRLSDTIESFCKDVNILFIND